MSTTPKKRKLVKERTIEDGAKGSGGCVLRMGANFDANKGKYRLLEATPEILSALTAGERWPYPHIVLSVRFFYTRN